MANFGERGGGGPRGGNAWECSRAHWQQLPTPPRALFNRCSSPAALSLSTPLYMQLYHGDGILGSLSRRPEKKPGRELPADIHRSARTGVPSPLAGCGGARGGERPLSAGRALPQPAPFPSPELEAVGALGAGRKLRVTVTHCGARLIARRCRRFITATLGSLDRTSRCGSVCPCARGAAGRRAGSAVSIGHLGAGAPPVPRVTPSFRAGPCGSSLLSRAVLQPLAAGPGVGSTPQGSSLCVWGLCIPTSRAERSLSTTEFRSCDEPNLLHNQ